MNTGCTTRIRTTDGLTGPISIKSGVRQGCPNSPVTFNLAIERVLQEIGELPVGYRLQEVNDRALAYADDLALVASSVEDMEILLRITGEAAARAGLIFNPKKCATLHLKGNGSSRIAENTIFSLEGENIEVMKEGDAYRYLGVPTGLRINQTPVSLIRKMVDDVELVDRSLLAPWQKMDALRTFIMPRLDYILRSGAVDKTPLSTLDELIKKTVKRWMNLPQRASAEVVFLPTWRGGAGILPTADLADILTISNAFRSLACRDVEVANVAEALLREAVRRRTVHEPSLEEIAEYLSGSLEGPFSRDHHGDPSRHM